MKRLAAPGAVVVLAAGLVACGSSAGPSYFLASSTSQVLLIQWNSPQNGQASGVVTYDSVNTSGSDPSAPDSLSVQNVPVTVTFNGAQVTFSGFLGGSFTGQLSGNQLSITTPPDTSTGQIQTGTLNASDPGTYNAAVAALNKAISSANASAAQAAQQQQQAQAQQQAQQQHDQQVTNDQQTASSDAQTLAGDVQSTQTDLQSMGTDVQSTATDLQSLKTDASQGAGTGPGDCSNMSTISSDASSTLASDLTSTIASDVTTLQGDIDTVNKDISTVQSDIQTLQQDGVSVPGDVSGSIGSAQSAIGGVKQGANANIATAAGYVDQGYQIANSLATGSCAGMGPGTPPSPPAGL